MKALILAAGRGSRMESLTDAQPKCLTALGGRPLIEWQRLALTAAGLAPIGIVTGYRSELLAPYAVRCFHNAEWARTNMVMSLACAREWLASEAVIVSYSDIFYSADTIRRLAAVDADIAISHDPHWLALWRRRFDAPLDDAESFRADDDGFLQDIGRRVHDLAEIQGQYMGLLRIAPSGWAHIKTLLASLDEDACSRLDMTSLLRALIERGVRIRVVANEAAWGEVDNPADLALYSESIARGELDLDRLTGSLPA